MGRLFAAHAGEDSYIFVSYAHEDAEIVCPQLDWLRGQGFNIWYDEGIHAGKEWTSEIADGIAGCSLFLFFVTRRSVVSQHCGQEISYAVNHQKQLLTIELEKVEYPSGLELVLSNIQAIAQYELTDEEYKLKLLKGVSDYIQRGVAQVASEHSTFLTTRSRRLAAFGTLAGLAIGVLLATLWFISTGDKAGIIARQNSLTESMATIEDLNSRLADSEDRYRELRQVHSEVLTGLAAPEQVNPPDGSHTIGNSIELEWTYGDDSLKDDFTLQIVPVDEGEPATRRALNKREMKYYYDIPEGNFGGFIWRLRKGDLNSDHEWSDWRRFTVYASAVDRLRSRQELVVGAVPAYKGPFSYLDNDEIVGFDIELVRWIATQLGEQLVIPDLRVRIVNYNWGELLPAVEDQVFDLAVGSLSKSKERTRRFKRIRFSDGYIDIKPVLLSVDEKILPRDLKNSVVGVTFDTTNEIAAMSLVESFGITVDAQSEYYPELKDKLLSGEIDFALVDDLLAFTAQGRGFYQHEISDLLKKSGYFERTFDESNEQYAIAVVYEPQVEDTLLSRVNGILRSPAGQRKLEELKARLADGGWQ